ncbi:efflux RND transporter periplasmic adaptor subunit [Chitinophaga rhizophila]|uniref:Efflux RND transporter periplasmic adaptor subunit n=1 Tax=Chitinophaga rhizophila TaxID=2866212 RepID=A0ABS7GHH3_9BACT|nr:efflux RND transporter periplasmic adaptor subunit [Chitinophaga rhizophila]MBW8687146.1 efflux RND transporter periplasmic adaptor subunit [Chitinophaga rhizophila]
MNKLSRWISLGVFTGLAACAGKGQHPETAQHTFCPDSIKGDLRFDTARTRPITESIHLTGRVQANPDNVVAFKSLFSGIVVKTFFSLGDYVKKGQLLAEVRSTEFSALNADLRSVESRMEVAQTKLKAVQAMFKDHIASQKDLSEAQSEYDVLNAEKQKIRSNQQLFSASASKDVFQLKAPASGYVTSKLITGGMQITQESDAPLFTISDIDEVWVMANVYSSDIRHVEQGTPVEIRITARPDEVFHGEIATVSKMLDEDTKVFKARIVLRNTGLKLNPGMLADITVLKSAGRTAVEVPVSSIVFSENENYVVIYKGNCEAEIRKIAIASRNHDTAFVGEGLQEGEVIVSRNQLLLFNQLSN